MSEINPNFKINPSTGPSPLSSYDSDEESFVVLGKSLINEGSYNSTEADAPNGNETCEEAKRVIDEEIKHLSLNSGGENINKGGTPKSNPFQRFNAGPSTINGNFIQKKSTVFSEMDSSLKKSVLTELESFAKMNVSEEKVEGELSKDIPTRSEETRNKLSSILDASITFEKIESLTSIPEDLHKKILDIIEENEKLKETVKLNSVVMKDQCNRIIEWQDVVQKVHEAHRQKIVEAKEHINKLTQERMEAGNQIAELQDELNRSKTALAETHIAQNEIQQSRSIAYDEISSLKAEIRKLQQTIDFLQKETNREESIFALKTQLSLEKKEAGNQIAALVDELNNTKTALAKIQIVETEVAQSRSAAYVEINSLRSQIQKLEQTIEELQKQKNSEEEIFALQTQRSLEKKEAENQIAALVDELNNSKIALAKIQIVQTEVEQSRSAAYVEINSLRSEIQKLEQTIEELQKSTLLDDIFALQTQLQLYKIDFEAERKAKESIKQEKEKLSEDLQHLQRRNQQLQERIDMISDRDFVMYESRKTPKRDEGNKSTSQILACPKCSSAFSDVAALQSHCDVCIT